MNYYIVSNILEAAKKQKPNQDENKHKVDSSDLRIVKKILKSATASKRIMLVRKISNKNKNLGTAVNVLMKIALK